MKRTNYLINEADLLKGSSKISIQNWVWSVDFCPNIEKEEKGVLKILESAQNPRVSRAKIYQDVE